MEATGRMEARPERNRGRNRQAQILDSAWQLFSNQGFGGTSMDAIAAAAAVSKATVYAYFASKEALFAAVVAQQAVPTPATAHAPPKPHAIATVLTRMADEMSRLILSDDTVAMYRITMSEARNFPDLGTRFYQAGPAVLIDRLAAYLEAAMSRGELVAAPPREAAAQFVGLILGELQLRALLHVGPMPNGPIRNSVAAAGVAVFMRAFAPSR